MEKRGSGLRKMRELTEKLPNYLPAKEPQYQTQGSAFYTTFYNLNWGGNGQIPVEEIAARITSSEEKYPTNAKGSEEKFGEKSKSSVKNFGNKQKTSVKIFGNEQKTSVEDFGNTRKGSVKIFGNEQKTSVKPRRLGRTAQSIIDLVIADGTISQESMAEKIGVSKRAIEMQIANLKAKHLLVREGTTRGGYWRIIVNNE